jgi:hypothetical protein
LTRPSLGAACSTVMRQKRGDHRPACSNPQSPCVRHRRDPDPRPPRVDGARTPPICGRARGVADFVSAPSCLGRRQRPRVHRAPSYAGTRRARVGVRYRCGAPARAPPTSPCADRRRRLNTRALAQGRTAWPTTGSTYLAASDRPGLPLPESRVTCTVATDAARRGPGPSSDVRFASIDATFALIAGSAQGRRARRHAPAPGGAGLADLILRLKHHRDRSHLGLSVTAPQPHVWQALGDLAQDLDGHDRGAVVALRSDERLVAVKVRMAEHADQHRRGRKEPAIRPRCWSSPITMLTRGLLKLHGLNACTDTRRA